MDNTSADLLARYSDGDESAATEMFRRYVERLTLLARSRLSPKLAARIDPEDVVMSAYRSFFVGARRGQFSLRRSGDLWRLLVSITLHKLYRGAKRHTAEMRSVDLERHIPQGLDVTGTALSREPTPDEAVALADELEAVMSQLDSFAQRVLELRLQGERLAEIAADTGRSERSVRRSMETIRRQLAQRLGAEAND
jgi:RNA polymerase sigma factor (sigma-70 family)